MGRERTVGGFSGLWPFELGWDTQVHGRNPGLPHVKRPADALPSEPPGKSWCNLYAEYIMRSAGLDEAQAGIQMAGSKNFKREGDQDLKLYSPQKLLVFSAARPLPAAKLPCIR